MSKADWENIRLEYITGDLSLRELAKKHGIKESTILSRSMRERWKEERDEHAISVHTKCIQKIADNQSDEAAGNAAKIDDVSTKLLEIIKKSMERYDDGMPSVDAQAYSRAIKTLKEVLGVQSVRDAQEQDARIAKLRREAEDDTQQDASITVRMEEGTEDWGV